MARTRQTARKSTGGMAPRRQLATRTGRHHRRYPTARATHLVRGGATPFQRTARVALVPACDTGAYVVGIRVRVAALVRGALKDACAALDFQRSKFAFLCCLGATADRNARARSGYKRRGGSTDVLASAADTSDSTAAAAVAFGAAADALMALAPAVMVNAAKRQRIDHTGRAVAHAAPPVLLPAIQRFARSALFDRNVLVLIFRFAAPNATPVVHVRVPRAAPATAAATNGCHRMRDEDDDDGDDNKSDAPTHRAPAAAAAAAAGDAIDADGGELVVANDVTDAEYTRLVEADEGDFDADEDDDDAPRVGAGPGAATASNGDAKRATAAAVPVPPPQTPWTARELHGEYDVCVRSRLPGAPVRMQSTEEFVRKHLRTAFGIYANSTAASAMGPFGDAYPVSVAPEQRLELLSRQHAIWDAPTDDSANDVYGTCYDCNEADTNIFADRTRCIKQHARWSAAEAAANIAPASAAAQGTTPAVGASAAATAVAALREQALADADDDDVYCFGVPLTSDTYADAVREADALCPQWLWRHVLAVLLRAVASDADATRALPDLLSLPVAAPAPASAPASASARPAAAAAAAAAVASMPGPIAAAGVESDPPKPNAALLARLLPLNMALARDRGTGGAPGAACDAETLLRTAVRVYRTGKALHTLPRADVVANPNPRVVAAAHGAPLPPAAAAACSTFIGGVAAMAVCASAVPSMAVVAVAAAPAAALPPPIISAHAAAPMLAAVLPPLVRVPTLITPGAACALAAAASAAADVAVPMPMAISVGP